MGFNGGAPYEETEADRAARAVASQAIAAQPQPAPAEPGLLDRIGSLFGGGSAPQAPVAPTEQPKNPLDPKNWEGDVTAAATGAPVIEQAPAYRVPAGFHPGTESWRSSPGMTAEEVAPIVEAQQQYETHADNAADAELKAAQMKAKNDAYYNVEKMKAEQQYAQEHAALEASKKIFRDEAMADLQKRSEAIANAKVNPEQFWQGHGGALGQVLAAVAVGMGQYSASRTGGQNAALGIINNAIDKNIAAQRDNIDNQKAGLQAKNSLYAQNLAAFGDKEIALLATKNNYLEQAKSFADQQAALNENSARALAASERFKADASRIQMDNATKIAQLMETKSETAGNRVWSPGGVVGGGVRGSKQDPEAFVPSLGGYAPGGKEAANKLNEKAALKLPIDNNMREAAALMNEAMTVPNYTPTGRLRLTQIQDRLTEIAASTAQASNVAAGQGAMSKDDKETTMNALVMGKDVVGVPDFKIRRNLENMKAAYDRNQANWRLTGEAYGVRRGGEAYARDAQGNIVPVPVLEGKSRLPSHQTTGVSDLIRRPGK